MEQSEEVLKYLRAKYMRYRTNLTPKEQELLDIFDPWINPDEGYIPYCADCLERFETYKKVCGDTCEMDHTAACLWYDYFVGKILKLNPAVKIVTKKDRPTRDR